MVMPFLNMRSQAISEYAYYQNMHSHCVPVCWLSKLVLKSSYCQPLSTHHPLSKSLNHCPSCRMVVQWTWVKTPWRWVISKAQHKLSRFWYFLHRYKYNCINSLPLLCASKHRGRNKLRRSQESGENQRTSQSPFDNYHGSLTFFKFWSSPRLNFSKQSAIVNALPILPHRIFEVLLVTYE